MVDSFKWGFVLAMGLTLLAALLRDGVTPECLHTISGDLPGVSRPDRRHAQPLQFHFDFSSPYGYLASERIETLAARHRARVEWRPMLLGAVFKVAGTQPLTSCR